VTLNDGRIVKKWWLVVCVKRRRVDVGGRLPAICPENIRQSVGAPATMAR